MTLQIFNSLTSKKEAFKSIEENKINLYICGVTVYDHCHIGHARAYVAFDTIRRFLEHSGYSINHVQNFTDIDDKIITKATETNLDWKEITETYINSYHEDMSKLNILPAHHYPKATEYIPQMTDFIQNLITKEHAYVGKDQTVYFSVECDPNYGKLSNRKLDDMESGARVEVAKAKRHPMDFVLWKPSKEGEPSWDSPWGKGRPGWHTECAVMVHHEMGTTIDIHGGGEDLKFPHHENELAQAHCACGSPLANVWMHNGFVQIDKQKMSKSEGNFFTIKEVLKEYDPNVVRFFLARVHYKSPIGYSKEGLDDAKAGLERLRNTITNPSNQTPSSSENKSLFNELSQKFTDAMNDDFNISGALGSLYDMAKLINTSQSGADKLHSLCKILGFFDTLDTQTKEIPPHITQWAEDRKTARANKDFAESDRLRDKITNAGYTLKDTPDGTTITKQS